MTWDLTTGREYTRAWPPVGGDWVDLLPHPYCEDPAVVLVLGVEGSTGTLEETGDGRYHIGCITTPRGRKRMLQVISPPLDSWLEHERVARYYGLEMLDPDYIGRLSAVPQRLLIGPRFPIVLLADDLSAPPLNLRNHVRNLTKKENNGN